MKFNLFSVAAGIAAVALVAAPTFAQAQSRAPRTNAPSQADVEASVRTIIATHSLPCSVSAARLIGRNSEGRGLYEVACTAAPGFLLVESDPPQTVNCFANNASVAARRAEDPEADAGAECVIESNLDIAAAIAPVVQRSGLNCQTEGARWVGLTNTGLDRYEVGCAGTDGYWLDVTADGSVETSRPCLEVIVAGGTCQLTTPQEQTAAVLAFAAGSGRTCDATAARFVGANQTTGQRYYEVGCADGAGFMVRTDSNRAFEDVVECAAASGVAGGCTLTDQSTALAAANAAMGARLAAAGITCDITGMGAPGMETGGDRRSVVEFACADRPLGLVAFLPNGAGTPNQLDCLSADSRLRCHLTPRAGIIERLNSLMSQRTAACAVQDFRYDGRVGEGEGEFVGDIVELKCAEGPGYISVISFDRSRIVAAQTCGMSAARDGVRCELS